MATTTSPLDHNLLGKFRLLYYMRKTFELRKLFILKRHSQGNEIQKVVHLIRMDGASGMGNMRNTKRTNTNKRSKKKKITCYISKSSFQINKNFHLLYTSQTKKTS